MYKNNILLTSSSLIPSSSSSVSDSSSAPASSSSSSSSSNNQQDSSESSSSSSSSSLTSLFENDEEKILDIKKKQYDLAQKILKNSNECYKISENFIKLNTLQIIKELFNENSSSTANNLLFEQLFNNTGVNINGISNISLSTPNTSYTSSSLDNNYTQHSSSSFSTSTPSSSIEDFLNNFDKEIDNFLSLDDFVESSNGISTTNPASNSGVSGTSDSSSSSSSSSNLYNDLNIIENELIEGLEEWINLLNMK